MNLRHKLRAPTGHRVHLAALDPNATPGIRAGKAAAQRALVKNLECLRDLQYLMYAENRRALLVVLQAMDGGGKDGTIRSLGN